MLSGHTILCFASGYDAPPTSKHHVMHLLAEHNTVLWVNYHGSNMPSGNRPPASFPKLRTLTPLGTRSMSMPVNIRVRAHDAYSDFSPIYLQAISIRCGIDFFYARRAA